MVYLYGIYDSVSEDCVVIGTANTDGAFVRQNVPYLNKMNPAFMNDYKLFCIGEFDSKTMRVKDYDIHRLVEWSCYSTPEDSTSEVGK